MANEVGISGISGSLISLKSLPDSHIPLRRGKTPKYVNLPATDELIRQAYAEFRQHNDRTALIRCAKRLGWPKWRVNRRGRDLGLARIKEKPWTDAEEQLLERFAYLTPGNIRIKFKDAGYERTATAIVLKRKRLSFLSGGEWMSANEIAVGMGIDSHRVTRWIRAGLLKAEKRGTNRTEQQGGDEFLIFRSALRKFLLACPEEYHLDRVEKLWFLDIITDGKVGARP